VYDTDFGSSRRSLAANLALLLGSTLAALALCEGGARLLLPAPQTVDFLVSERLIPPPGR
jgi:hypothetical protein